MTLAVVTLATVTLAAVALAALVGLAGCDGDDGPCNAERCPGGCCDADGICAQRRLPACGLAGAACADWTLTCSSSQTCDTVAGKCVDPGNCSGATCKGCCDSRGRCQAGNVGSFCGVGGVACSQCTGTQVCTQGVCAQSDCDVKSCPGGCCQRGRCLAGTTESSCGSGGTACAVCKAGERCAGQTCTSAACGPSTCPDGCCDSSGNCVPGATAAACGIGGAACVNCGANKLCDKGNCENPPQTCDITNCPFGCCDKNGACVSGTTQSKCGTGGVTCSSCSSNQVCAAGKCTCSSTSCSGCCDGTICRSGNTAAACGSGGAKCASCTGGNQCVSGTCKVGCDFATCSGCCDSSGACKTGGATDAAACGRSGNACVTCSAGATCSGGTCNDVSKCSSSSCPSGCCKDGTCISGGTAPTACGRNGNVCAICGAHQICDAGSCKANPLSTWDVTVTSVTLDKSTTWDSFLQGDPEPDVYVRLTIGSVTKQTKTVDNTYTPVFNEYLMTVTAADLTRADAIRFEIFDEDTLVSDDRIADCTDRVYNFELAKGSARIPLCISGFGQNLTLSFKVKTAK